MAEQPTRRTLVLPMDLGSPAQYEQTIFPLSRVRGTGTANQMHQMAGNAERYKDLIHNAKTQYDLLVASRQKMAQNQKSLNPVKMFSAYRSVRLLLEAGKALYTQTRV
ncbi:hypothetical protein BDR07DRAFT_1433746 [Suillus spraguei]|nr:hypothetical protein BDR07DRAFT_1433746 [Suillus spraguei]